MNPAAILLFLARGRAWAASPLGRAILAASAVLGLLGGSWAMGHHSGLKAERSRWEAKVKKDAEAVAKRAAKADIVSADLRGKLDARTDQIITRTRTLIQKVPIYVTAEDDSKCVVPSGAVSLLNAAVFGDTAVPVAPGGPDKTASPVPLSAVVEYGVENTGIGQMWREEALTWRAWYSAQLKAWK